MMCFFEITTHVRFNCWKLFFLALSLNAGEHSDLIPLDFSKALARSTDTDGAHNRAGDSQYTHEWPQQHHTEHPHASAADLNHKPSTGVITKTFPMPLVAYVTQMMSEFLLFKRWWYIQGMRFPLNATAKEWPRPSCVATLSSHWNKFVTNCSSLAPGNTNILFDLLSLIS